MPTVTGIATEFIQFTRASNATVTDSDGKVKWAPHNLLLASESFDAASWTKSNATIAANSAVAPNGTTTADKVYPTINGSGRGVNQRVLIDGPTNYSVSIYAKAAGKNFIAFTDLAAADFRAWVNLSTGAKTETAGYFVTVTSVGNGWYNCVFTQTATAANPYAYVVVCDADSSAAVTVNGTDGVHLWGASLYRSDLGGMQPNTSAYPMYNPTTPKNMLGFTEDITNAYWTKFRSSAAAATNITAPNGLQTADKLVPQSSLTQGGIYNTAITAVIGGVYTASVYAKAAELGFVFVCLNVRGSSTAQGVCVNLATGARSNEGVSGTYSVVDAGNGWWRISCTGTAANTIGYLEAYPLAAAGSLNSYTGDGTSGIYLWGAQLSDSASLDPYVPVYGAAVTSAAYYGPRRDFDGATLACKGLLVEEQRSNLVLQSAAFDNAAWTPFSLNTTGTPQWVNAAIAPDGTMTADKLIPNTSSTNVHAIASTATIAVANTTAHTWSVYAKADGYDWIAVVAYTNSISYLTWFNVATGAVGTNAAGNTAHPPVAVGNGWYRLSVTRTTASTVAQFILYAANADNQPTFAGDGTKGVLVWGAQLEANASFATSYIPTGAATATRNADVASVSTQAFPYSATEGTLVANVSTFDTSSNLPTHINLSDGTTSNYIRMNAQPTSYKLRNYVRAGGADVVNSTIGGVTVVNDPFKAGVYYKTNSFNSSVNGAISTEVTTGAVPSAATTLSLGNWFVSAGTFLNGHIRQITYLPRRISNAELQTRTT